MTFKPVRHLSWTAKVFCIAIGYISSKDFLDEHHNFDEIEAVHRFGNHGNILALGWRKQAIALRIRPMSIKAILRQQPSTWPDRSMKETPGKRALTTRFEAAVVTLGCTKSHPVLRSGFEFQRTILPSLVCVSSTYDRTCMLSI